LPKPAGLDLDGHLRGGCGSLPYLCFSFLFFFRIILLGRRKPEFMVEKNLPNFEGVIVMMPKLPFHPKYGFFDFDSITGFDACHLSLSSLSYDGFFLKSPIDGYMQEKFKFKSPENPQEKPFKARWMISELQLYLMYVNGILNGKRLNTLDIFPEFPEEDFFHPVQFNGILEFIVLTGRLICEDGERDFRSPNDHMRLSFSGGKLVKKEYILGN
jgi:hypothetical protein